MELVNITYRGTGKTYQDYKLVDDRLIVTNFINSSFGAPEDYVELSIFDEVGQLIDIDYNVTSYYPSQGSTNPVDGLASSIEIDPKKDLQDRGYNRGLLNTQYGFYKNLFNSTSNINYWIKEISRSRTELKLSSQFLSNTQIQEGFAAYQTYVSGKNYFTDFYVFFEGL